MATQLTRPGARERTESFLHALAAMDPRERVGIYRSGGFTWTANYPEEVPLVNDEFEWIALRLADLD